MPRIRTVKPEFWTDESLTECSMSARLLFIGMFNFADDNGNIERSAKQLKMKIFPADAIDCDPLVIELITHGLLSEYSVSEKKYLHIKGFRKHQVINRPSKTNIPTPESCETHGVLSEGSVTEEEGKGREKEKEKDIPPTAGAPDGAGVSDSPGGDKPSMPKFNFKSSLVALGVEPSVATQWMKVRRDKKASNTELAFKRVQREVEKSGWSANDAITLAVEKSWKGFEADWLPKSTASIGGYDW